MSSGIYIFLITRFLSLISLSSSYISCLRLRFSRLFTAWMVSLHSFILLSCVPHVVEEMDNCSWSDALQTGSSTQLKRKESQSMFLIRQHKCYLAEQRVTNEQHACCIFSLCAVCMDSQYLVELDPKSLWLPETVTPAGRNSRCPVGETCSLPSEFSQSLSFVGHSEACTQLEMF